MKALRATLISIGVAMMGFGVVSALIGPHFKAFRQVLFLVAVLVLHDGLLLPIFLGVGFLVHRFVPSRERALVQGALIVTAAVTVVALPFMLAYGRTADLPSALPRNYVGGYLLVIALVWCGAAAVATARRVHKRTPRRTTQPPIDPGVGFRLDDVSGD